MEIRDPIHVFVRLEDYERALLDSRPVQRLRNIHQLATTAFIYPGATHKRFEHSLGVMELATRVFDTVTKKLPPSLGRPTDEEMGRWRCTLRVAALCHDIGHLPFSHAAEKELLPAGVNHEILGRRILESDLLKNVWDKFPYNVRPAEVAKLAMGPDKLKDVEFSRWELLLSEIITADALGADRMDYLLRDSYHAGVAYGRFDHYRLIEKMCILELPRTHGQAGPRFRLGVDEGGLVAAEALLLARYQMYSQVYFHKTRRILDVHLKDFFQACLDDGQFPTSPEQLLALDDNRVLAEATQAAEDSGHRAHEPARRLLRREHYRELYRRNPKDQRKNSRALWLIAGAARREFGDNAIRVDPPEEQKKPAKQGIDFPILTVGGEVVSSTECSEVLRSVPPVHYGFVFVDPALRATATEWLQKEKKALLRDTQRRRK